MVAARLCIAFNSWQPGRSKLEWSSCTHLPTEGSAMTKKLVEFIGGPLDGHRQDITEREKPLPALLQVEISANTYGILDRKPPRPDAPTTSVAVYELKTVNSNARYAFVAAKKPAPKPTADR